MYNYHYKFPTVVKAISILSYSDNLIMLIAVQNDEYIQHPDDGLKLVNKYQNVIIHYIVLGHS